MKVTAVGARSAPVPQARGPSCVPGGTPVVRRGDHAKTRSMTANDEAPGLPVPDHRVMPAALRLATWAPSVHSTQPWRWIFDGTRLRLYTDADRLPPSTGPHGRQLVISCGAVLHHARTTFADRCRHTYTTRVPDHLAVIEFQPWVDPPEGIHNRALAIVRRRTDRLPMTEPDGFTDVLPRLWMLTSPHEVELSVLDDSVRPRLATASEQVGALRRHDLLYQIDVEWWTGYSENPEGVPAAALVSDAEFARVGVGRAFPPAPHSMRPARQEDRARLVVLCAEGDSVTRWLRTGEALSARAGMHRRGAGDLRADPHHRTADNARTARRSGPASGHPASADPHRNRAGRHGPDPADPATTGDGHLHRHRFALDPLRPDGDIR